MNTRRESVVRGKCVVQDSASCAVTRPSFIVHVQSIQNRSYSFSFLFAALDSRTDFTHKLIESGQKANRVKEKKNIY